LQRLRRGRCGRRLNSKATSGAKLTKCLELLGIVLSLSHGRQQNLKALKAWLSLFNSTPPDSASYVLPDDCSWMPLVPTACMRCNRGPTIGQLSSYACSACTP
jgi:hypothetical protein